jgi:restriction endonuclease
MTAKKKGNLLEDVVALMHEAPGYMVETRKTLPITSYPSESKREFDVVITTTVAGCAVRIAISCKNEKAKVGTKTVSDFIDALGQVGISTNQSIIVSVAGFTKDALESAAARNIRCLVFSGLTEDRLNQAINEALQSTLYLYQSHAVITKFDKNHFEVMGAIGDLSQLGVIYEIDLPAPPPLPTISNIIWDAWSKQAIPHAIGMHSVVIHQKADEPQWMIFASTIVIGLVASTLGTYNQSILADAQTGALEKMRVHADFDTPPVKQTLVRFETEEELEEFFGKDKLTLVQTVSVPRIGSDFGFWPPDKEIADEIVAKIKRGEIVNPSDYASTNILDAWEFDQPYFQALRENEGD